MRRPTFHEERLLVAQGHRVIGVDEVGCGCLAGPVIAAAVELPLHVRIGDIADSKLLSAKKRYDIVSRFLEYGLKWTIGMASVEEIDRLNIRAASKLAMRRAIEVYEGATFALIDAWKIPELKIQQKNIIHGDRIVKSIAAASIIAKVVRDRLMDEFDERYPQYGFRQHKGYATLMHRTALAHHGPSPLHRKSFIDDLVFLA